MLDEPTIGLHPRDNTRLLRALHKLRDLGNTLLVVEHDREIIEGSDYLCDFGPGSGKHGGNIVAQGTPKQLAKRKTSLTGPYLSGAGHRHSFESTTCAIKKWAAANVKGHWCTASQFEKRGF